MLNDPESPLRKRNSKFRSLISVGGWNHSDGFSNAVKTDANRHKFATSIVEFLIKYKFNGVDIDWEYPVSGGANSEIGHPEDTENFGIFLSLLRQELNKNTKDGHEKFLISLATAADTDKIKNLPNASITKNCDWVNLMTYDYSGPWSDTNQHNAPLKPFVDDTINAYVAAGYPISMLNIGLPFYGRKFKGITKTIDIGQQFTKDPCESSECTIVDYRNMLKNCTSTNGYENVLLPDIAVKVHWNKAQGIWISGESVETIKQKAAYAMQRKMNGVFVWHMGMDSDKNLVDAILEGFKNETFIKKEF